MDRKIETKDIDFSRKYTGYLWLSNAAAPIVLTEPGTVDSAVFKTRNPFVAEGQLYDSENDVSISIRYADGGYFIVRYEGASGSAGNGRADNVVYCSERMVHGETIGLRFRRFWKLKEDEACLHMKSLSVEKEVFIGFTPVSGADHD